MKKCKYDYALICGVPTCMCNECVETIFPLRESTKKGRWLIARVIARNGRISHVIPKVKVGISA